MTRGEAALLWANGASFDEILSRYGHWLADELDRAYENGYEDGASTLIREIEGPKYWENNTE